MSKEIKTIRKRDGVLEDKDSGTVYVGSSMNDTSVVVGDSNVTVTPGNGGSLKCVSGGVEDICAQTTDPWLAPIPGVPAKIPTKKTFPFFSYIVPITAISVTCAMLIKKEKTDG